MRQKCNTQLPLTIPTSKHPKSKLMEKISTLINENPTFEELIWQDLTQGRNNKGAQGLTAEQILRIAILMSLEAFTYDALHFHLHETPLYQSFCRIGIGGRIPYRSAMAAAIKSISAETWGVILRATVQSAAEKGIEKGRKVRVDCTVVESNIHAPFDSTLLYDCIRVITRELKKIGFKGFHDRTCSAKRRMTEIRNARGRKKRRGRYRVLIRLTREMIDYAEAASDEIIMGDLLCPADTACILSRLIGMAKCVISQTERRVIHGEKVPSSEKIVSIFEPHTDIIRKDRRDTYYGHKICLTAGKSNLVLDCTILEGNPADSDLPVEMIERQKDIYGHAPLKAAFDGGFASKDNLDDIRSLVSKMSASRKSGVWKLRTCAGASGYIKNCGGSEQEWNP